MKFVVLTKVVIEAESLNGALERVRAQKKSPVAAFNEVMGASATDAGRNILTKVSEGLWHNGGVDKPKPFFSKAATVAGLIVAFIVMFASTNLLARDRGEGITLQITEVDTQKIGEHKAAHIFHRSDVTAITGHIFQAKADGKVYILSSPKDMLETGTYDARFVDKGRALIVREDFNGKRMNIRLAIDSVMDQPKPAPMADVAAKLKDAMAPAKAADASHFVISPTPSSNLGVCVQIMTFRDGSQTCMKWADKPIQ